MTTSTFANSLTNLASIPGERLGRNLAGRRIQKWNLDDIDDSQIYEIEIACGDRIGFTHVKSGRVEMTEEVVGTDPRTNAPIYRRVNVPNIGTTCRDGRTLKGLIVQSNEWIDDNLLKAVLRGTNSTVTRNNRADVRVTDNDGNHVFLGALNRMLVILSFSPTSKPDDHPPQRTPEERMREGFRLAAEANSVVFAEAIGAAIGKAIAEAKA